MIQEGISIYQINNEIDPESLIIIYFDLLKDLTIFDIALLKEIVEQKNMENKKEDKVDLLDRGDLIQITKKYSIEKFYNLLIEK